MLCAFGLLDEGAPHSIHGENIAAAVCPFPSSRFCNASFVGLAVEEAPDDRNVCHLNVLASAKRAQLLEDLGRRFTHGLSLQHDVLFGGREMRCHLDPSHGIRRCEPMRVRLCKCMGSTVGSAQSRPLEPKHKYRNVCLRNTRSFKTITIVNMLPGYMVPLRGLRKKKQLFQKRSQRLPPTAPLKLT